MSVKAQEIFGKLVAINEKAITAMRSSKMETAVHFLHQAIEETEDQIDMSDAMDQDELMVEAPQNFKVVGAIAPVLEGDEQETSSSFAICHKAMTMIQMPTNEHIESNLYDDLNLLHASLFFNLGLCHHLHGMATGKDVHFRESLLCYDTAMGTLGLIEQRTPYIMMLELASLNNSAHIHHVYLERTSFHQCLKLMKQSLCEITNEWTCPVPQQVSEFSHNLLMNSNHHTRPAPAA